MSTILMYHDIADGGAMAGHEALRVPVREFAWQCEWLAQKRYGTLSVDQYDAALAHGFAPKSCWLTFDDGRLNNYTQAFPLLVRHGLRATFFLIADRLRQESGEYFSSSAAKEMLAAGMNIGAHSCTHPHLARIPIGAMRREVLESKDKLEQALQTPMRAFCYPYGNWNAAVVDVVREAGFSLAVSTIRGNRNRAADRYILRRAMVQPGRANWKFPYMMSPVYDLLHAWKNRRRWKEEGTA